MQRSTHTHTTHTHTHTHTHTDTPTHAHTHTRAHAHPHAHPRTHTRAHARTRAHTNTHNTHGYGCGSAVGPSSIYRPHLRNIQTSSGMRSVSGSYSDPGDPQNLPTCLRASALHDACHPESRVEVDPPQQQLHGLHTGNSMSQ